MIGIGSAYWAFSWNRAIRHGKIAFYGSIVRQHYSSARSPIMGYVSVLLKARFKIHIFRKSSLSILESLWVCRTVLVPGARGSDPLLPLLTASKYQSFQYFAGRILVFVKSNSFVVVFRIILSVLLQTKIQSATPLTKFGVDFVELYYPSHSVVNVVFDAAYIA